MKELSIFIDESGDFGKYDPKAPFYIISMVLHDQRNDISNEIDTLNKRLSETTLSRDFVHTGPLIRRENEYKNMSVLERLQILRRIYKFSQKVDFLHSSFIVEKKHAKNETELIEMLARKISDTIRKNYAYFLSFDKIKIYYDNGQSGVMKIIVTVFTTMFRNVEFKKAFQRDYKMLQVTDFVCTMALTEQKMKLKALSKSERNMLGSDKNIKKNFLLPLSRKRLQ